MGLVSEAVLLDWQDVFSLVGLLVALGGLGMAVLVAQRPWLFWPMLLVVNTIGNGPRVTGYVVLDEIFTGFIVVGAAMRIAIRGGARGNDAPAGTHRVAHLLLVGYLICQAMIGVIENGDLRLVRWVLFFGTLVVAATIVYRRSAEFPFPPLRQAALILVWSSVVYYIAYLTQGAIGAALLGPYGRFLTQDYIWSGSAYAVLPTLIATPAAVHLMGDRARGVRYLAWLALGLMMLVAFYYDSRLSWVFLLVLLGASWRRIGPRRLTIAGVGGGLAFMGARFAVDGRSPFGQSPLATVSTTSFTDASRSDAGRLLHLQAAAEAALADSRTLVVGTGLYSHRFVLVPYVKELLRYYLPAQDFVIPGTRDDTAPEISIIRTQGAAALLIDTGLVGVGLLALNIVLLLRGVVRRRSPGWPAMAAVMALAAVWLFTNNILDIVMFHLLFMPAGFIEQWAAAEDATRRAGIAG